MTIHISSGSDGISIGLGDEQSVKLTRSLSASQTAPKGFYVYGHFDSSGVPFYIGKGTGRRAWNADRHRLWHRYVKNHLQGKHEVVIIEDDLDADDAERVESLWIAQESETLVNWISICRKTDFAACEKFNSLQRENLSLVAEARHLEAIDLHAATEQYRRALSAIEHYSVIQPEQGLIGRLIDEERLEEGLRGELLVLDRLTLCLCKLGQGEEAKQLAVRYFAAFKADECLSGAEAIKKRVNKTTSSRKKQFRTDQPGASAEEGGSRRA